MSELQLRVRENLQSVEDSIRQSAQGRAVTLVCVTKYAPIEQAAALLAAGAQHLGENQFPQASERFNALRQRGLQFTGHMLGPLQSRKAKQCAESCDWYQALERIEVAHKLNDELATFGKAMDVLIQIHVGDEDSKHGIAPASLDQFIEDLVGAHGCAPAPPAATGAQTCAPTGRLRIRGLMCIPPGPSCFLSPQVYEAQTRRNFRQMADLFARMQAGYPELPIDTLSMGMSGDYRWAIAEGANMVRIGRALFEGLSV
jgi:PLP dependent protein